MTSRIACPLASRRDLVERRRHPCYRELVSSSTTTRIIACCSLIACLFVAPAHARAEPPSADDSPLPSGAHAAAIFTNGGVRGITVGPIESALHPQVGYGTAAGYAALVEARAMGASWVALTPFGRVWDLNGGGVDLTFEEPVAKNSIDVLSTIEQAHDLGLRVMLVPHLWVETGGWRALINPDSDEGWEHWAASYGRFLLHWADIAERGQVEIFSVGVELRSWVTTSRAPSFIDLIGQVRQRYRGLLTYSGNWDDVEHTVVWGELDLIGVNAFYPLTDKPNASFDELLRGGKRVATSLKRLARAWHKPVLLTEMGYTTRVDPALRPWEWPDNMANVQIDEAAQARAYRALLAPLLDANWCAGFFLWRTYADPNDVSQEAEWGFSPRGKLAELVVRDAFITRWASDAPNGVPSWLGAQRARTPGIHAWELSPSEDHD